MASFSEAEKLLLDFDMVPKFTDLIVFTILSSLLGGQYIDLYKMYDSSWVFEDAVVDTLVVFINKNDSKDEIIIRDRNNVESTLPKSIFLNNPGLKIDYRADQKSKLILQRILSSSSKLKELAEVKAGIILYEKGKGTPPQTEKTLKEKPFTVIGNRPKGWRPLVRGGDVNKYNIIKSNEFVDYGEWLAAPREERLFIGERIVIRRTDDVLRATIINDDSVCVKSCHILFTNEIDHLKAILAIINSALIQKIYELMNPQMVGKAFAEVKKTYVEELPIILPNDTSKLSNFVDQMFDAQKNQDFETVKTLTNQIDVMIFDLYEIKDDELNVLDLAFISNK